MNQSQTLPISIFLIVKNEAARLPRTLEAVQGLASELIVIDSGSSDSTVEIAKSFGAKVIVNMPFPGYGEQKRFGEEQCQNDWVLNIDADEVLSPKLVGEIKLLFQNGQPIQDGFRIRIVDMLPNETRPGLFAHAVKPVRLYRRSRGRYNPSVVHDRVDMVAAAKLKDLRAPIHHFPIQTLGQQIEKLLRYTDWQSSNMIAKSRKINPLRIYLEFPFAFFKAYILRRYILRGTYGFLLAINYAYYRVMRLGKVYEKRLGE